MRLAVSYSSLAESAFVTGGAPFDLFKCPMNDSIIHDASKVAPVYVHFPLKVGKGIGDAYNSETRAPADWTAIEHYLKSTETKYVNVHLGATVHDLPDIAVESLIRSDIERITSLMLHDLEPVIRRFGREQVILENRPIDITNSIFYANVLPEVIRTVLLETGCGLLLDLAHAKLSSHHLGIPFREYVLSLPTDRLKDVHVSGVQRIEGAWIDRINALDEATRKRANPVIGQLVDHLSMTDQDWVDFEWFLLEMKSQNWSSPYTITFEYGGINPLWNHFMDESVITAQTTNFKTLMNQFTARE